MKSPSIALVLLASGPWTLAASHRSTRTPLASSDPFYPSPWMSPEAEGWTAAYAQAKDFVSKLTLLEKVNLTTGTGWLSGPCVGGTGSIPRLGFRSLCMQDSPIGVRYTDYNSVFPSGQTTGATFDRELMRARGYAMGQEHRDKGVNVLLGPVGGPLGRAPEGGRPWEGFSTDPVLTGVGMAVTIQGIQSAGVIACAKHLIGNEQEHFRQAPEAQSFNFNISESLSSNIDDRTLHELYLWPFADAVRAGVGSVMCAYTQVNNSYSCQNSKLLNNILKDELGFQGFVMSDWVAQHTGVASAMAGLDMTMPGDTEYGSGMSYWGANLTLAVLNGTVPEWRIDDMAMRIMAAFFKVGQTVPQPPVNFHSWSRDTYGPLHPYAIGEYQKINWHVDVRRNHASLIREIAAKGTVLLKNSGVLPLKKPRFVAVIGEDAGSKPLGPNGCIDGGCNRGTLAMGWGSGTANFPYLVSPDAALQERALLDGSVYQSVLANDQPDAAVALVSQQDVTAIVFVNANSGEEYLEVDGNHGDRNDLYLFNDGDLLVQNVSSVCNNTIVVIHSVGPVLVTKWYDNPNITAILWAGLPGQESGNAITDVLYGHVNPAARSPFTWGATRESYGTDVLYKPNNGQGAPQMNYSEGVFIDYRYFDRTKTPLIYEFGYGLSYTTFAYSNLKVSKCGPPPYTPTIGTRPAAPRIGKAGSSNLHDYLFPSNLISAVSSYIYPYLGSTDAKEASGDPFYGQTAKEFLPPHATDGSAQPLLRSSDKTKPGGNARLYDTMYTVTADIKNNGTVAGDEVAQLYVSLGGPEDPVVQLRGFERISLKVGETKTVSYNVTRRDLSNWDTKLQDWVISKYPKRVFVGRSSRNLDLSASLPCLDSRCSR